VLHKEIPFLRICVPLCAGIISGLYLSPGIFFIITSVCVIILLFAVSLRFNRTETNILFGAALFLSLLICGNLLYNSEKKNISELPQSPAIYSCTLTDYPAEKPLSRMLLLRLHYRICGQDSQKVRGSILVYLKKDSAGIELLPGDNLRIRCTPAVIETRGNPCEFDYRFYMLCQGIKYFSFANTADMLSHTEPDHRDLEGRALIIREKIIAMYRGCGITGERLALVAAITLGQKNMLDSEQKSYFVKAGIMHIMAVSGLHTVILSLFIFNVLFFMKGKLNIIRIVVTIIFLWGFAFVTGLTPSVLRATLMFSFLQAGKLMNRPSNGINSVLASAFILILLRPSVIFDAGFLLSYSAVIYIIAFYNDLRNMLLFKSVISDKIWQSASVTIIAQAGTLPLTIALFNRFPTYFILTNIIIVPLSSVLVIIGVIIPLVYRITFLAHLLGTLLGFLTGTTEYLTKLASSLPLASIENIGMTTSSCIIFSILMFAAVLFILRRDTTPVFWPLLLLIVLVLNVTFNNISLTRTNELITYNTTGYTTIGIRSGRNLHIYSDTLAVTPEVSRHSSALGLRVKMHALGKKDKLIRAGNLRVLITGSPESGEIDLFMPDLIILRNVTHGFSRSSFRRIPSDCTIIFNQANFRHDRTGLKQLKKIKNTYDIRKKGAYIRRITI
jgi:competence protein ComEC